jgi:hypothetical protein
MSLHKFTAVVIFMLLAGWNTKTKGSTDIPVVNPLTECKLVDNINEYIDRIEVIPFTSPDSIKIANITKVLVADTKDMILLSAAGIYKCDPQGRLTTQFGRKGRGAGEYLKIYDICLNNEQTELWCLTHLNEVMKYDLQSGRYIETIDTQSSQNGILTASGIAPATNNGFYLFVPNPEPASNIKDDFFCLHKFSANGELTDKSILRKDFNVDFSFIPFVTKSYNNVYLLRPQENENICYEIAGDYVRPLFEINFGKENIPPLYSFKNNSNPWENLGDLMTSNYYKIPFNIFTTQSHIAVSAFRPVSNIAHFIISSDGQGGIHRGNGINIPTSSLLIVGCDEEYFYILFDKYELRAFDELYNVDPLLRYLVKDQNIYLSENENPKIIKVKFKATFTE